jgi:imidazolonepropionase-like amidohydrolase
MMFGTDVGYMDDPTIGDEVAYLGRCGLDGTEILRMLTTVPTDLFGVAGGRVEPGLPADLTILDGDPVADVTAYSRVLWTIRGGRVLPGPALS